MVDSCVLLTRSRCPCGAKRSFACISIPLACVRPVTRIHPEPGSNSFAFKVSISVFSKRCLHVDKLGLHNLAWQCNNHVITCFAWLALAVAKRGFATASASHASQNKVLYATCLFINEQAHQNPQHPPPSFE